MAEREAIFSELVIHGVDAELVEAVKNFQSNRLVRSLQPPSESCLVHGVDFVLEPRLSQLKTSPDNEGVFEAKKAQFNALKNQEDFPGNAGELLSKILAEKLLALKGLAPVRQRNALSKSAIARAAHSVLSDRADQEEPPGPYLLSLCAALMEVKPASQEEAELFRKRKVAIEVLAQAPDIQTRKLAKLLEVDASTVSRWRNDAEFRKSVDKYREFLDRRSGREKAR